MVFVTFATQSPSRKYVVVVRNPDGSKRYERFDLPRDIHNNSDFAKVYYCNHLGVIDNVIMVVAEESFKRF